MAMRKLSLLWAIESVKLWGVRRLQAELEDDIRSIDLESRNGHAKFRVLIDDEAAWRLPNVGYLGKGPAMPCSCR